MKSVVCLAIMLAVAGAAHGQYQQSAPSAEDVGGKAPPSWPAPRGQALRALDVPVLAGGLALGAWVILKVRRRWAVAALGAASLAYFGFYRGGCVCPIGASQNVTLSLVDSTYTLSIVVTLIFLLPIAVALFAGRIFCGGLCPLGAVQDLLLRFPLHVPRRLDKPLRALRWAYLAVAAYFVLGGVAFNLSGRAIDWTVGREFLICRYDPFVNLFRSVHARAALAGDWANVLELTGPTWLWSATGGLLLLSLFVGRPYCRWLCPYGAVLGLCARAAKRGVTVMPDKCCDCRLCERACPFGAIQDHRAVNAVCLACARCHRACPQERKRLGLPVPAGEPAPAPRPLPPAEAPRRSAAMVRPMVAHEETLDLAYLDELIDAAGAPGADGLSAVLPLLQAVQARHRYLPKGALELLSTRTGVELGRVMDVATFYNQFRLSPVGEHHVCVCHGTACHVAGAGRISEALTRYLEIPEGADTDARRRFTVTPVACLGCCSLAPVMQIGGVTLGHLTATTACQALDSAAAGKLAAARPLVEKHVAHAAPPESQRRSP